MSRPFKMNQTPTAPFSLRELGPMRFPEVERRLAGATYRTARGASPDTRATVDPKPCPHCNSLVEWSTTAQRGPKGENVRYVYARCRGNRQHRWSFGQAGESTLPSTPPRPALLETIAVPSPRPSAGANLMGQWIAGRIRVLESELTKLRTIETLAQEVTGRTLTAPMPPRPSKVDAPTGDVVPNGTPPGLPHGYRTHTHN